jgi:UDP-GlcNAc3NAcA epimerase
MRIVTILGARPQFIKASAFSRAARGHNAQHPQDPVEEIIVHTGQHFDANMSDIFFEELDIPKPHVNLEISGLSHGAMTGRMLEGIESVLVSEKPDVVLIYGDTNSTLAGALAASKLHIPIAHVEAGLRSFNMRMPEEINRILSDRISGFLFCPTTLAVQNLSNEAITNGVYLCGDTMLDVTNFFREKAASTVDLAQWGVEAGNYNLATIHREENTNAPERLVSILTALKEISAQCRVVLPLHPRTSQLIDKLGLHHLTEGIKIITPVSYLEMTKLQMNARSIITDSGGVQKEAFFHRVPCITLRDETEWTETVDLGWNTIVGADGDKIREAYSRCSPGSEAGEPYGDGFAAHKILQTLKEKFA